MYVATVLEDAVKICWLLLLKVITAHAHALLESFGHKLVMIIMIRYLKFIR